MTETLRVRDVIVSREPDAAARRWLFAAGGMLVVAVVVAFLDALQLAVPGLGAGPLLSHGHLHPMVNAFFQFGWLSFAGVAAALYITPRVCGVRLRGERAAQVALYLAIAALVVGVVAIALGATSGVETAEFPWWVDAVTELSLLLVAGSVFATIARRRERAMYVSLWYIIFALVAMLVVNVVGNTPGYRGLGTTLQGAFFAQASVWAWSVPLALAAALYVVPKATGNPLVSQRLAAVGFWSLAVSACWTGGTRLVFSPLPSWVATVGTAFAILLAVPIASFAGCVYGTLRGKWSLVDGSITLRYTTIGTLLLLLVAIAEPVQALRSISRVVGLTAFPAGTRLLTLAAASMLVFGFLHHALPRLSGRDWFSARMSAVQFWLLLAGFTGTVGSIWGTGLVQGFTWFTGATGGGFQNQADGWEITITSVVSFRFVTVFTTLVTIGAVLTFVVNALRSLGSGPSAPVEVVRVLPVEQADLVGGRRA